MEHILQNTIIKSTCFIYCGPSFTFTWQKFKNFRWFDRLLTGDFCVKHCITCLVICVWGSIFYLRKICFLIPKQTAGLLVLINGFNLPNLLLIFHCFSSCFILLNLKTWNDPTLTTEILHYLLWGNQPANNNICGKQKEQFLKKHNATGAQIMNYTNWKTHTI